MPESEGLGYSGFVIEVEYPNGKKRVLKAQTGNGTVTAEQLADRFHRLNMFPGAKNVTVTPSEGPVLMSALEALKNYAGVREKLETRGSKFTTPKPILKKATKKPKETPTRSPLGEQVNFAGDNMDGARLASPGAQNPTITDAEVTNARPNEPDKSSSSEASASDPGSTAGNREGRSGPIEGQPERPGPARR